MSLDLDAFYKVMQNLFKKEAKEAISRFSTSALAFGGDKKAVKNFFKPYMDVLDPKKAEDNDRGAAGFARALSKGKGSTI